MFKLKFNNNRIALYNLSDNKKYILKKVDNKWFVNSKPYLDFNGGDELEYEITKAILLVTSLDNINSLKIFLEQKYEDVNFTITNENKFLQESFSTLLEKKLEIVKSVNKNKKIIVECNGGSLSWGGLEN